MLELPTIPFTVIRCVYAAGYESIRVLHADGSWQGQTPEYVRSGLTGFEVLAEPRAITARAVLNSVGAAIREQQALSWSAPDLAQVEREFGVK